MHAIGYVYVACGFIFLAIIVTSFDPKAWIKRGLKRGDLHLLADVASGLHSNGLPQERVDRLQLRGMISSDEEGNFRATIKGRVALRIRQWARRRLGYAI